MMDLKIFLLAFPLILQSNLSYENLLRDYRPVKLRKSYREATTKSGGGKYPVDCAASCHFMKTCIGIVKSTGCRHLVSAIAMEHLNETVSPNNFEDTYLKIDALNTSVCPDDAKWEFISSNNVTSVYYVRESRSRCKSDGDRTVTITSMAELYHLNNIQAEVGHPLVVGASANGTRWKWSRGREPIMPMIWFDSIRPPPVKGTVGAIIDDKGLVAIYDSNNNTALCECYSKIEG